MKAGLPISLLGHVAVIFGGFIAFGGKVEPIEEPLTFPIELVTVAEINNVRATRKVEDPKENDLSKPTMTIESVEAPEPEPESEPEPPKPEPEPDPVPDPEPEDQREETEPTEDPTEEPPEDTKVAEFNLDNIEELIRDTQNAQIGDEENIDEGTADAEGVGEQTLSAVELEAILRQAMTCYTHPDGAPNAREIEVHVGFDLDRQGRPSYVSLIAPSSHHAKDPYQRAANDAAIRAVERCGPYDFLPQDRYSAWRTVQVRFAPYKGSDIQGYIEP